MSSSSKKKKYFGISDEYFQKYLKSWETEDIFKGWPTKKVSGDSAICLWYDAEPSYTKGKNDLAKHAMSKIHKKNAAIPKNNECIISNFTSVDNAASVLETVARITSILGKHSLLFSLTDSLGPFLQSSPRRNILNKVRLGKQIVDSIVRESFGPYFKKRLLN